MSMLVYMERASMVHNLKVDVGGNVFERRCSFKARELVILLFNNLQNGCSCWSVHFASPWQRLPQYDTIGRSSQGVLCFLMST